ncbi:hypothetical protein ACLOAV_010271 [Pseudogymnoascus australis]
MDANEHGTLSLQNPFFLNHTQLHMLGVNILTTPTLLSFSQLQNFFLYVSLKERWPQYFWSHMDVGVASVEEDEPFESLHMKAVYALWNTTVPDYGRWAQVLFSYDRLALVNTAAYTEVGAWDTQIPYYLTDCDMHERLAMAGFKIEEKKTGHINDVGISVSDLLSLYRKDVGPQASFVDPSVRKVKCDERHPVCGRCASTGRVCQWLAPESSVIPQTSIERRRILPLADAAYLERRSFDFFSSRTVRDLAGLFDSDLWEFSILQMSQSEKAPRHATIALSSLQEAEETYGMPISKDRAGDVRHRFAARHYSLAIHYLSEGMRAGAENVRLTTLITCLVFIHIELLRGRYAESLTHLQSGLQILEGGKAETCRDNGALEEEMRKAFQRLDLQSAHFGQPTSRPRLVIRETNATISGYPSSPLFTNLSEAKDQCDILMNKSLHFVASCGEQSPQERIQNEQKLLARQAELTDLHHVHLDTLLKLTNSDVELSSKDRRAAMILRMQLIATNIHLAACLAPNSDTLYDQHLAGFKDVVALAETLISDFSSPVTTPQTPGRRILAKKRLPTFFTDWGIVLPLYFTAIKCRDSPTRHAALNVLDSWRHREGFWDSALAHKIASQIVQMEEVGTLGSDAVKVSDDVDGDLGSETRAYLSKATHRVSGRMRKKSPVVPEHAGRKKLAGQVRIVNTLVEISEDQQHVTLRMTRKLQHSEGNEVEPDLTQGDEEGWVTESYELEL